TAKRHVEVTHAGHAVSLARYAHPADEAPPLQLRCRGLAGDDAGPVPAVVGKFAPSQSDRALLGPELGADCVPRAPRPLVHQFTRLGGPTGWPAHVRHCRILLRGGSMEQWGS